MGRKVTVTLNDALYNAGVLGFLRVCKKRSLSVKEEGNTLSFDSDILQNFTEDYLETLIATFRDDAMYTAILDRYTDIKDLNFAEESEREKFNDGYKFISDKLKRNSYLSGYEIIKARGESYDFTTAIKDIKNEADYHKKVQILTVLIEKIRQYEDVLLLKDIAYTRIQPFWSNAAFLYKQHSKLEFTTTFADSFAQPAHNFMPKEGKKVQLTCAQCNADMSKKDAYAMAWINDVGVDTARKTSYFWNYRVDSYLCPICNLMYACMPLGFTQQGPEAMFINENTNIKAMEQINTVPALKLDVHKDELYYRVLDHFRQINQEFSTKKEIHNIQIIRRSEGRYVFNILSKEKLKLLGNCHKYLRVLVGVAFKRKDGYLNVYQQVIKNILNGENLYPLIYAVLYEASNKSMNVWFVQFLIKIQAVAFAKGDEKMREKIVFGYMKRGEDLRKSMLGDDKNENKIRTLSYKLLNALKVRNSSDFMDTILRCYIGLGLQIPNSFLDVLKQEDKFLEFGYAFVTGLNGGLDKKEEVGEDVKYENRIDA